jgi:hypothetical protein
VSSCLLRVGIDVFCQVQELHEKRDRRKVIGVPVNPRWEQILEQKWDENVDL